jgi:hypothetical protein
VAEMLSTFAEGYSLAKAELAGELRAEPQVESETDVDRGDQPDLFDDDR